MNDFTKTILQKRFEDAILEFTKSIPDSVSNSYHNLSIGLINLVKNSDDYGNSTNFGKTNFDVKDAFLDSLVKAYEEMKILKEDLWQR